MCRRAALGKYLRLAFGAFRHDFSGEGSARRCGVASFDQRAHWPEFEGVDKADCEIHLAQSMESESPTHGDSYQIERFGRLVAAAAGTARRQKQRHQNDLGTHRASDFHSARRAKRCTNGARCHSRSRFDHRFRQRFVHALHFAQSCLRQRTADRHL